MARPDAVVAAFKATARVGPTPAPQGANLNAPGIGQISPLAASLANERGYANTYGPFLPRSPQTFTTGAFGPFSPILPVPVDEPAPGADMPDPRLWEYVVGWNLPVGQPGSEGIKLASFGTLKTLADLYSVARQCIELRKAEILGLDWDIVPTKDAAKAYNGKPHMMRDWGGRQGAAKKFFSKPDPDYFSFSDFLSVALEDIFVFDAFSLLLRPKRGYHAGLGRGVLGSELDCIEYISGPTIRPLVGLHGERPRPPDPAYQQYLYGVPRSDYMQLVTERDLDEHPELGPEVNRWSADMFIYRPLVPRRWTPYGFPPIERALIPVMSGLQKQAYQLDYFKEGTIPAVYISPGDVNMTPGQIRELQTALNAFAGDPAWHHKVIVLPPGSKVDPQKPVDVADQFDDVVMTQVCMAFDVNPMELGILPKVAATATPSQVKQFAQQGSQIHERLSTKPLLKWLCDIFDTILHQVMGQDDMKFTFEGLQEDAEQGALTQLLVQQVQNGIRSVDEARDQLELQPWGLPATSGPVVFTAAGPIPFGMTPLPATPGQQQGGQQNATGGNPDKRVANGQRRAPTAGPAPLQQAGRSGGQASPTPGHAAATAALATSRTRTNTINPAGPGSVSAAKNYSPPAAFKSELDMLVRHLNNGRLISTWVPRYIDARTMAVISEDLAKGLTPEQCADIAKTIVLGKEDYEWLPKDESSVWEDLTASYTPRIDGAFGEAIAQFDVLLRRWWSGGVAGTPQQLTDAFRDLIATQLQPVLEDLWAESWRRNDETAGGYFEAWAASEGRDWLEKISSTRMKRVRLAIQAAVSAGQGPDAVIRQLAALLDVANRAQMIAVTEEGHAANAATITRFRAQGTTFKEWLTANDSRVCPVCRAAQDEGAVPIDTLFSNGLMGPPAHPRCRCVLMPAMTHGVTLKGDPGAAKMDDGAEMTRDASPKRTKESVSYRASVDATETCGDCVMWRAGAGGKGTCTDVEGEIRPDDVCDIWFRVEQDEVYKGLVCEFGHVHQPTDLCSGVPVGLCKGDSEQLHPGERDITCDRGHTHHGEFGAAGLLIRHKGDDGKTRYLFQKRSPEEDSGAGKWGLPGGAALQGESAQDAAFRESQEELGDLPPLDIHHHVVDDHGNWQFTTFVCDTPERFNPPGNGATSDETDGYGWFTPEEIARLPLHPAVAQAWDAVRRTRENTTLGKCVVRHVNISGQEFWSRPDDCPHINAPGGGGPTPLHHDEDGIWHADPDDYSAGRAAYTSEGGGTGEDTDTLSGVNEHPASQPSGDDGLGNGQGGLGVPPPKGDIPQGYQGGFWPQGGHGTGQAPSTTIGGQRGVAPSVSSGKPLPGARQAERRKGIMNDEAERAVLAQLRENFPEQALEWVPQGVWSGPALVPLKLIDFSDMETWSAYHEPDRVEHFEHLIQEDAEFNPVVMVKVPGHKRYRVVDGHHRALAYRRLGEPVKAWTGDIPFGLVHIAEETHSSQEHQGSSPQNQ